MRILKLYAVDAGRHSELLQITKYTGVTAFGRLLPVTKGCNRPRVCKKAEPKLKSALLCQI